MSHLVGIFGCPIRHQLFYFTFYLFLSILFKTSPCDSSRITSKIYQDLDNRYFCFVRLNATHQIGCSSSENGNSGIVKVIRDDQFDKDMNYILSDGNEAPYVAVITSKQFKLSTLKTLRQSSNRVSGVIVLGDHRPDAFSSDRSCPNERFSLYINDNEHKFCSKQQWNKPTPDHLDGILFHHWPFPIFLLLNKTEIDLLLNKTKEHEQWPKLAIELISPMNAAIDSVTCTRRTINANSWYSLSSETYCDPLGGVNIYGHTFNFSQSKIIKNNSVIVLASRLDTFSMFDGLAPGADSVMSSLIAILSIAELLNRKNIRENMHNTNDKALFLSLFDGEAFDYIGSSQAAYQMKQNIFPLPNKYDNNGDYVDFNLAHLSHFIELGQVAHHGDGDKPMNIYLHKHLKSDINELTSLIKTESYGLENDLIVEEITNVMPLPPSSVQSFLKMRNDTNFKVVVITNHQKEYINKYYNSLYEDGFDVISSDHRKKQYIAKMKAFSTLISRVLYKLVTGEKLHRNYETSPKIIEMLFDCFLKTSGCYFFTKVLNHANSTDSYDNDRPFPSYVSVYKADKRTKLLRQYIRAALNYFTGENLNITLNECMELSKDDLSHTYLWQNGFSNSGECVRSTVYTVDSISPGFDAENMNINYEFVKENTYAIWTESKWKMSSLKLFVVSSQLHQLLILISGLILLLISLAIVAYFSYYYEFYFDNFLESNNSNRSLANSIDNAANIVNNSSEDYPDWIGSSHEIEYAAITSTERTNSDQVFS